MKKEIYTVIEYCNGKPNAYIGTFDDIKIAIDKTLDDAIDFIRINNEGVDENDKYCLYDVMSYDGGETFPNVEYIGNCDNYGEDGIMFKIDYQNPMIRKKHKYDETYEYKFFISFLNELSNKVGFWGEL